MSQGSSGYERIEGDAYYTPAWVTEALFSVEVFGMVWDPACGAGHIVDVARRLGRGAYGSDIAKVKPLPDLALLFGEADHPHAGDFLKHTEDQDCDLITNPPYGKGGRLAVQFIRHALTITQKNRRKVAMLLRVDFDSASTRRHIFGDHPAFAAKYTLTKRIRWANLRQVDDTGKPTPGPTDNHAWYVWDWSRRPGERPYYGYLHGKDST